MSTSPGVVTATHALLDRHEYLRIDNTHLDAVEVAERVIGHFGL